MMARLVDGNVKRPGAVERINDISLPDDGTGDVPMTADLYYKRNFSKAATAPLVIVLPGFGGVKSLFTNAGHYLANAGYATMVVEQLRPVTAPPIVASVVRPWHACTCSIAHRRQCPADECMNARACPGYAAICGTAVGSRKCVQGIAATPV
jgi:dienelactone hydrolase